jgi:hypothetical protein
MPNTNAMDEPTAEEYIQQCRQAAYFPRRQDENGLRFVYLAQRHIEHVMETRTHAHKHEQQLHSTHTDLEQPMHAPSPTHDLHRE